MFCQSCGHQARNDASFCGNCGKAGAYLTIIILYILIRGHAYAYPPGDNVDSTLCVAT
jgi:predicted amidophosphoribosyltransferase